MAKDVAKAVAQFDRAKASGAKNIGSSHSLSVGFKKQYSAGEQVEIKAKRREMRERLAAVG